MMTSPEVHEPLIVLYRLRYEDHEWPFRCKVGQCLCAASVPNGPG
jgi:hypothetical protein